ncbi:response regulator [Pelagicoccus mobilis]|uniref:Response regulator transcription factor n=1 Tax=Pelagicoccus mobilis TaxID=415221 RepID=A0A934S6M4_9BACT|nr:response regulator transcription factor [Pelagicoccus mobilis]MBK1879903.1 response regulator transcription factor [Pelagicoccus mobilis]
MKKRIRIMLVEDHPEYRDVIEIALSKETDLELVGEFGTAEAALRSLEDPARHPKPDVILLDLNLPGISGIEAIPFFTSTTPNAKIIVLTQSDREADVLEAIHRGAGGYLLKSSTVARITEGIRSMMDGGAPIDSDIANYILKTLKTASRQPHPAVQLSKRELEILSLLATGQQKKEIASQLDISVSTVVTHVNHIYEKLNVANAPAAVGKAYRKGILPTED